MIVNVMSNGFKNKTNNKASNEIVAKEGLWMRKEDPGPAKSIDATFKY